MRNPLAWLPIASGLLVLVLSVGVGALTLSRQQSTTDYEPAQNLTAAASEDQASMALSPDTGEFTFTAGQSYPVGILVDSAGKEIDGVDVIISFDPTKVEVVGQQVTAGSVLPEVPLNKIDNTTGKIRFSALTFEAKAVNGILGTFRISPKKAGEVNLTFDYTAGATTDSNMAEHGTAQDILGKVTNARYTFK